MFVDTQTMWHILIAIAITAIQVSTADPNYSAYFLQGLNEATRDNSNEISADCRLNLIHYRDGLLANQGWALEMLDAGSKLPLDTALKTPFDFGSLSECIGVSRTANRSNLVGKYCYAHDVLDLDTKNRSRHISLASCLPNACSSRDLSTLYNYFGINATFIEELCESSLVQAVLGIAEYCGISFFGVIGLLIIISTGYDIYLKVTGLEPERPNLLTFSVIRNIKAIFSKDSGEIPCLNGIRVLSVMWIILYQRQEVSRSVNSEWWDGHAKQSGHHDLASMFLLNGSLAIDTFLLLSGILLSYSYLALKKKGRSFKISKFYIHRYLRLAPVLIVVIVFVVTLLGQTSSGPFSRSTLNRHIVDACSQNWWQSLLFIQNYVPEACLSHTWYLAIDVQLYVISPIFLLSLSKWPKYATGVTIALLVCNAVAAFTFSWIYELNGTMEGNLRFPQKIVEYFMYIYYPAYMRAAPWLIGILVGHHLHRSKNVTYKLSKPVVVVLWVISITVVGAMMFGGYDLLVSPDNKLANSLYNALARPAWALSISAMIFACINNFGGPINRFLSSRLFTILSQLTYTLYVIHYVVILILVSRSPTTKTFGSFEAMHEFWGDFAFSLLAAILLTLGVEVPILKIEKSISTNTGRYQDTAKKINEIPMLQNIEITE
ncbi:nose resistant to fluoxetine protein 6-like isoform X1 [Photinus pyralis]|uniref:nose resistant to fluoxetine protein 6-like isoform X1 n=2 Tax=Photinus pyralis TaxID=7054 RepID=UPI0012677A5A|nr:nose resistant to fluoxetine protein 6-like isoform X1 [Photinus pyralis]